MKKVINIKRETMTTYTIYRRRPGEREYTRWSMIDYPFRAEAIAALEDFARPRIEHIAEDSIRGGEFADDDGEIDYGKLDDARAKLIDAEIESLRESGSWDDDLTYYAVEEVAEEIPTPTAAIRDAIVEMY